MPTLTMTLVDPVGVPVKRTLVAVRLIATSGFEEALGFTTTIGGVDLEVAGSYFATPDAFGMVELDLVGNSDIQPANTVYRVDISVQGRAQQALYVAMPSSTGSYDLLDVLTDPPPNLDTVAPRQTYTVTNALNDRGYDADAVTLPELADVVATLIADLRAQGLVA